MRITAPMICISHLPRPPAPPKLCQTRYHHHPLAQETPKKTCRAFARKKSATMTRMDECTTERVVALPTPTVPPDVFMPSLHATVPMMSAKTRGWVTSTADS